MAKRDETTICVKKSTRDRLRKLGSIGGTFDDVIVELLDANERKTKQPFKPFDILEPTPTLGAGVKKK